MEDKTKGLNAMQKDAVLCTEGPLLILAGAGSGKTKVLTHRTAYIIDKGTDPYNILAITFTNKAANEMKERIYSISEQGSDVWISTFHSMCVRILRRDIEKMGYGRQFTIYDASDSEHIIKNILKEMSLDEKNYRPKAVMSRIGRYKDELISPEAALANADSYVDEKYAQIYKIYQERLKRSNGLDFDDIIYNTVYLFENFPEVAEKYRSRFKYIMVDEYQDTSTGQYKLIKNMVSKYQNICVVGDDDQSIYGWRGANIRNILDFEKDYENARVIKLEQNYRSTKLILNAANSIIANNKGRKAKKLWTENDSGEKIGFFKGSSEKDEAYFIAREVKALKEKGIKYSDIAVLYRVNQLSRAIEEVLVHEDIPYKLLGGQNFYGRKEIKDVLSYIKVIFNNDDSVSLRRIINVPKRGIGETTVSKIEAFAAQNGITLYQALLRTDEIETLAGKTKKLSEFMNIMEELKNDMENLSVSEFLYELLDKTLYKISLLAEGTEEAFERAANVDELINKAADFDKNEEGGMAEFLENISLIADIDRLDEDADAVALMTIHSSKGLEFPVIFVAGFEDGIFPGFRAVASPEKSEMEEERRLCYVAVTRAKKLLYITWARSRYSMGKPIFNKESRFFDEIPSELLRNADNRVRTIREASDMPRKARGPQTLHSNLKNYTSKTLVKNENLQEINFSVGDKVKQKKYGIGEVIKISDTGDDYEVTVRFPEVGIKKLKVFSAKLRKV